VVASSSKGRYTRGYHSSSRKVRQQHSNSTKRSNRHRCTHHAVRHHHGASSHSGVVRRSSAEEPEPAAAAQWGSAVEEPTCLKISWMEFGDCSEDCLKKPVGLIELDRVMKRGEKKPIPKLLVWVMNFEMMKVLLMISCFFVGERIERRTWVVFFS